MTEQLEKPNDGVTPDDGILFLNEYLYENDLITEFARLQASPARRVLLAVVGAGCIAGGIWLLMAGGAWAWLGIPCILGGLYLLWRCHHLRHHYAQLFIDAINKDPSGFGERYRRVAVGDEGLMVFARNGVSRHYRFEDLDRMLQNDRIIVAVFGGEGVCVPRDTFMRGTDAEFEQFLEEKARRGRH